MPDINWALIGIAVSAGAVLLFRTWRSTFPAILFNYVCLAFFMAQQQFLPANLSVFGFGFSTVVVVKLITGFAVTAILLLTALTFSREYGLEDLDEFGLSELRRAARAAQRQPTIFRPGDYLLPLLAGGLALLASLALPRLYPIASIQAVDFAWYWLAFTGLLTLATANDLPKIGLGLLLCTSSIDLLYTALAQDVSVVAILFISLSTILLALMIAYLSGLLYGRLKTLELSELYRR
jgi:multisubunit Na+/H+ antiporter MnhC subunit